MNVYQYILLGSAIFISLLAYYLLKKIKRKSEIQKWIRLVFILVIGSPLIIDFARKEEYKLMFILVLGIMALLYAAWNAKYKDQ